MIGNAIAGFLGAGVAASTTAYESIATTTVGSGGVSSITFSSIPATYTHLQIRMLGRSTGTGNSGDDGDYLTFQCNSSGVDYSFHHLKGNGSAASALALTSNSSGFIQRFPNANTTSNVFGGIVLDILNYTSVNKAKTFRALGGFDRNGAGAIYLSSNAWFITPVAINQIVLTPESGNFVEYSSFALYGIKGA